MRRILILSNFWPPVATGPSILLYNLFKTIPSEEYKVITGDPSKLGRNVDAHMQLNDHCCYVPMPNQSTVNLRTIIGDYLAIPAIVFKGLFILWKDRLDGILAISRTTGNFLIAGYILHKLTKRDLYVYLFDVWEESRITPFERFVVRVFEPKLFRSSKRVFVMSENMAEFYLEKYSIVAHLIPHSVEYSKYKTVTVDYKESDEINIVFTGFIFDMQRDEVERLVDAVEMINRAGKHRVKLLLYTGTERDKVFPRRKEIYYKDFLTIDFALREDIRRIQMGADILFLPMAFESERPVIARTASPSKMPEYLAAQRPILVHAPAWSYVTHYARKHKFAMVVDNPDPKELADAVCSLIEDGDLRAELVRNARNVLQRHDYLRVSAEFMFELSNA